MAIISPAEKYFKYGTQEFYQKEQEMFNESHYKKDYETCFNILYCATIRYAHIRRKNRYIPDLEENVLDMVSRTMERIEFEDFKMASLKYCDSLAMAAMNMYKTKQKRFEDSMTSFDAIVKDIDTDGNIIYKGEEDE